MKLRFRSLAALLALLGLTVSVAEQSWAAACMEMDGSTEMAMAMAAPHDKRPGPRTNSPGRQSIDGGSG